MLWSRKLLTKRELRNLDGFFWSALNSWSGHTDVDLKTRVEHSWILEEFIDAIEWLETQKR